MLVSIPASLSLWEAVATVQVLQSLGTPVVVSGDTGDTERLFLDANLSLGTFDGQSLAYSDAYRRVEETDRSYIEHLAKASDLEIPRFTPLKFPHVKPSEESSIIVAPYALKKDLDLPISVWQPIIHHLRTYDKPVKLMTKRGMRLEAASFTESEILSNELMSDKLAALASATLVVGTPNEWTWLATAWERKLVILYPEHVPPQRWFWQYHDNFGRIVFQTHMLQIPVILAGLRTLIATL